MISQDVHRLTVHSGSRLRVQTVAQEHKVPGATSLPLKRLRIPRGAQAALGLTLMALAFFVGWYLADLFLDPSGGPGVSMAPPAEATATPTATPIAPSPTAMPATAEETPEAVPSSTQPTGAPTSPPDLVAAESSPTRRVAEATPSLLPAQTEAVVADQTGTVGAPGLVATGTKPPTLAASTSPEEGGVDLVTATATPGAQPELTATSTSTSMTATPTATTTATATSVPTATTMATATPVPTAIPTASPTARPTATPTATVMPIPTATSTATPVAAQPSPEASPPTTLESVRGKILFRSDRLGEPRLFVMDSHCLFWQEGCKDVLAEPLQDPVIYDQALDLEPLAADGSGRAVVLENGLGVLQVYLDDYLYGVTVPMTPFEGMAYDPAWSPRSRRVVMVSTEPDNHEIYAVDVDGTNLRRLTYDEARDEHPTWAPNGMLILFHSDRSGRRQLWLMNADGSAQRNVSNNSYNDWDPIWVK